MVRRKGTSGELTPWERYAGTAFFVVYLVLLPLAAEPLFDWAQEALGQRLDGNFRSAAYYYGLVAATVLIFHSLLARTTRRFAEAPKETGKTILTGIIAMYGLNELVYRLTRGLAPERANLNNGAVTYQMDGAPHMTLLIVLLLAPFVEEVLFRGLVFGGLRERSRLGAYGASCVLFALLHVWQFAVANRDAAYFLTMVQYLVPGAVLAWAYEHTGTLWASAGIHAAVNAVSVLSMIH